jgi:hypothetical protein
MEPELDRARRAFVRASDRLNRFAGRIALANLLFFFSQITSPA